MHLAIIISAGAAAAALGVCFHSLFRKTRTAAGLTVASAAFVTAIIFVLAGSHETAGGLINVVTARKAHLALLILLAAHYILFTLSYPFFTPTRAAIAAAFCLPGLSLCVVTLFTGLIVTTSEGVFREGAAYPLFTGVLTFYLAAAPATIAYKSLLHRYRALSIDLRHLSAVLFIFFSAFIVLALYLPLFFGIGDYVIPVTIATLLPPLLFIAYASGDAGRIDMKQFTMTSIYWLIIFTILIAPVALILTYNDTRYIKDPLPLPGVALIIFAYLFLVFKYLRPKIEYLFRREERSLVARVDSLFGRLFSTGTGGEEFSWEESRKMLVNGIAEQFTINGAHLYLYDGRTNRYFLAHETGEAPADTSLDIGTSLTRLVESRREIIYRYALAFMAGYTMPEEQRMDVDGFFERNRVEVILPFHDREGRAIGLLALGRLGRIGAYSKGVLSVLDLFRIQFQQHLANALVMEEARATQVLNHDRLVVSTVKNSIIPERLAHAAGYRISSLYLDNSPFGGDYFDSVTPGDKQMLLFMADASYHGVDSSLILLELYTILHTPGKRLNSPDALLNTMNWVISTSRFPVSQSPAFCASLLSSGEISCSSAGFHPMTIIDQISGDLTEIGAPGPPLGADRTAQYGLKTARLAPGSIGLLYSRGLSAAENHEGETFGVERIREIVKTGRRRSPADLTRLVYEDLDRFTKGKKQARDISVVIFKLQ
ncbi:MAG: serine/threonine-protein phosphatase [Spirochaetes bacterium]|nr:serine/threonine-protein phosphatase [Spirochaetota bacterium]